MEKIRSQVLHLFLQLFFNFSLNLKLFYYLQFMQPINNLISHQTPARQKISLQKNTNNKSNLAIDEDLMNRAINKSYLKQMVGCGTLRTEEIVSTVSDFIFSFIPQSDIQKELEQFWCIVALNQDAIHNQKQFFSCKSNSNVSNLNQNCLKLYQLFIGLGSKQLRFQSLQSPKGYFVVNMDTVETHIVFSDVNEKQSQSQIRLLVQGKYNLDFYFTSSTLPFGLRQNASEEDAKRICSDIAKHTNLIIRKSIQESKGIQYGLKAKELPDQEFYLRRYATQQQFTKYSQTGDVILFRDNHTMAKVQRFFTNSQCDHIGLVYKDEKYGLCIFQSNSGTGVSLAMWNQLIRYKWFQNIQGIYWRRLNMQNKPANFQSKIKQFVKVNLHKEYGLSVGKLLSFKEIVYSDPEQQKNRTYFCSQLIAALYKYLNILEPDKPSSTYLPKDFTDKGSLNMINNTALEAERRLIFNEKLLKESYKFYK